MERGKRLLALKCVNVDATIIEIEVVITGR